MLFEPTACSGVLVNVCRVLLVPHSNQAVVSPPLGLTLPDRVAPSPTTPAALVVAAVGEGGADAVNAIVNVGFQLFVPVLWLIPMT